MKNTRIARLLCVGVALLLAASSLAACTQPTPAASPDQTQRQETQQSAATEPASTAPAAVQIHVLASHFGWVGPDRENPIRDEIRKRTGIDIDYETWQCASEDEYRKKLNMYLASSEFPCDVFLGINDVFSVTLFNSLGEKGGLWELDGIVENHPAFNQFASPVFVKYRDQNNGKLYGYPYHINNPEFFNVKDGGLSIRVDWMKSLGLDYPKNPDEYYNLLKSIKDNIKAEDGAAVIPLSLSDDGAGIGFFGAQFVGEYGSGFWVKDSNGQYVIPMYSYFDKTTKFVLYMNKLMREGLMDEESFTQKKDLLIQKASTGRIGATASLRHNEQAQINDLLWAENKDYLMAFMPSFPDAGIEKAAIQTVSPWGGGYTVFPKSTPEDKVDAYFTLADFVLSEEGTILTFMGIEGQQWNYDADGKCKFTDDFVAQYPTEDVRQKFGLWIYQSSAADWFRIDQYSTTKPEYLRQDYKTSLANMNDKYALSDVVYGVFPGSVEQQKLPTIDEAWKQVLVKAVLSKTEEECLAALKDFPDTLNKLGYSEILTERNELVAKLAQ